MDPTTDFQIQTVGGFQKAYYGSAARQFEKQRDLNLGMGGSKYTNLQGKNSEYQVDPTLEVQHKRQKSLDEQTP